MEKYGFVYIWFDRKHRRFYIGCHWGTENDGYICSSKWMKQGYKYRPYDFKRRILSRIYTSMTDLYHEEFRWLSMIKEKEIGKRYYNLTIKTVDGTPEHMSELSIKYWSNPANREKQTQRMIGTTNPDQSNRMKDKWNNSDYLNKVSESQKKTWTPERKKSHGKNRRGEKNNKTKLTEQQVKQILKSSDKTSKLAKELNVTYQAIWQIRKGINWNYIQEKGAEAPR